MVSSNKVNYFELHRLRIGEQIEFLGMVLDIVEKHNPKDITIERAVEPFKKTFRDVESRFKQVRNSKLTAQLTEKDALRDNDIICLRMIADAMTRYFDSEVKSAAETLLTVIDQYGTKIYDLNYREETAVIRNLVKDLKTKPSLVDAVKKMNLKALVTNLEKNNNEFREIYMTRVEQDYNNRDISAGEIIKEAAVLYRNLIRTLESKAFLEPSNSLNDTIGEINIIAQKHAEIISQRESLKDKYSDLNAYDNNEAGIG